MWTCPRLVRLFLRRPPALHIDSETLRPPRSPVSRSARRFLSLPVEARPQLALSFPTLAVKLSDDGTIEGLNGVKLEVNPDWTNPSGEWRVGYKRVYQLFTSTLRDRITKERRKAFEKKQQAAVREAVAALAAAEQKGAEKKEKAELEARIKMLEEMMEGWKGANESLEKACRPR